jgi:polyhydroxyalkanoate synthesis regulator phasin
MSSTISSWTSVGWTAIGAVFTGAVVLLSLFRAFRPNSFPPLQDLKDIKDILGDATIEKIRDDLEAMKGNVEALMTAVPAVEAETLRDILTSTRDEVRAMKGVLTDLASVLTAASADLAPVLTAFTDEVRAMRGASTDLVGEMTAARGEVDAMREDVQGLRADVATSVNALPEISSELRLLRTDVSKIQRAGNSPLRSHLG